MRSRPASYRLSFLLPPGTAVNPGLIAGWVPGCTVQLDRAGAVIVGPSRERVFEQGARLLRVICRELREISIAATLESPLPVSGRDGWTIIVNSDVAFAPTTLGASFPKAADATRALV